MPRSGAGKWAKEDYYDDNYLYQHKFVLPTTKSHAISMAALEGLRHEAIDKCRKPAYVIEHAGQRWYLVLEMDFIHIPQPNDP